MVKLVLQLVGVPILHDAMRSTLLGLHNCGCPERAE